MGAYSKTLLEDKPTVAELVKLIKKSAKGSIADEEDLDTYYRKFWIVAVDLVEADIINKKQHDKYFWKGLPRELRYAISDRLEARDADFESDQVPEVEKAMEAGRFVLRKAAARKGWGRMSKKGVTNFIRSYLHHFFDDSHGLKASLKPLRRPFDRCQSHLEAINNGRDIKQINW